MLAGASKIFNLRPDLTAAQIVNQHFPNYVNPDRFGLFSSVFDEKSRKVYVKLHGSFTSQAQAESVAREAMQKGYQSNLSVCDTRSWLPFPPERHQKVTHVNSQLEKLTGVKIEKEEQELKKMKKRVMASKNTKPTTALGRYEALVMEGAQDIIDSLKDEKTRVDLQDKFEKFKAKEIAKLKSEQPKMDPILEQHYKEKAAQAAEQDKKMFNTLGNSSMGMGMPSGLLK